MKKMVFFIFFCWMAFSSCHNNNPSFRPVPPAFAGKWELEHLPGYSQSVEIVYPRSRPWFEIDGKNGNFRGYVVCNNISGNVVIPDSVRFRFLETTVTEKKCSGDGEAAFLHALGEVRFYHWQHPDSLWLLRENRVVMRLVRMK